MFTINQTWANYGPWERYGPLGSLIWPAWYKVKVKADVNPTTNGL